MSVYIERLRTILAEYAATSEALDYINRHWQRQNIDQEVGKLKPGDFMRAKQNLESTYLIRLYAEFEGILKDHLATNHPRIRVPDKPKVDWLISRVILAENISVEQPLRRKMDAARDFRNSIAHRSHRVALFVAFNDALSTLNTFLARLPDPLTD